MDSTNPRRMVVQLFFLQDRRQCQSLFCVIHRPYTTGYKDSVRLTALMACMYIFALSSGWNTSVACSSLRTPSTVVVNPKYGYRFMTKATMGVPCLFPAEQECVMMDAKTAAASDNY